MKSSLPFRSVLLAAAVATLAAGCHSKKAAAGDAAFDDYPIGEGALLETGDFPLAEGASFLDPSKYEPVATPAGIYPVYFPYNQSSIPAGELSKADAVAAVLAQQPGLVVLVEGNCDERGTNEYNMSLGEFRAQAVRERLAAAGVAPSRIQTVSYGEEKPAAYGHDESAWAQNRRADFGFYRARQQ